MTDLFARLKPPGGGGSADRVSLPNFLVIGAHRSGTTSLYYELAQDAQFFMAPVKETNFFAVAKGETDLPLTPNARTRLIERSIVTAEEYVALFDGSSGAVAVGEVSPSYLYSPTAAKRIKASLPQAKLVAILRNPVDRAYSAFARRTGGSVDVSFEQDFVETAVREAEARSRGEPADRLTLVDGSLYGVHLSHYYNLFERSQIHIALFEDLWSHRGESWDAMYQFLEADNSGPEGATSHFNASGSPRSQRLDRLIKGAPRLRRFVKTTLPRRLVLSAGLARQRIEKWNLRRPHAITDHERSFLLDRYFRQDIRHLAALTGKDFTRWLDPTPSNPMSLPS